MQRRPLVYLTAGTLNTSLDGMWQKLSEEKSS
ncbi:hypothetical protein PT2222_120199 [Paraburkholderia tropica]